MSLWVKTLRQLTILVVASFFFSCEDESSLLGFPTPKFNVRYVDIPLSAANSQVMVIDSLITDLRPLVSSSGQAQFVDGVIVGKYQDADFGTISTQPYLSVYALSNSALNSTAVFDSITVRFRLNFYGYGFAGQKEYRFPIHEITGDTLSLYDGKRYYANTPPPEYGAEALGEVAVTVQYDSLLRHASLESGRQDTLYLQGKLSDEFGARVFNLLKGGFSDVAQQKEFKAQVKGLTLLPDAMNEGLLGMNLVNSFGQLSRILVHYHTTEEGGAVKDTLTAALGFEYATYTTIDVDRTGTELDGALPYEPFAPAAGQGFVQSGAGVVTRLDLAPFYTFADTLDNIVVNSAEMMIDNVTGPEGVRPHNALMLQLMNTNSNQFLNSRVSADRELAQQYYVITSSTDPYYFPATETGSAAMLVYSNADHRFSGFMTRFAQSLFANRNDGSGINENRLRYVALVPSSLPANRGVTRTLFNADNVTLRIYYTRASPVTP